MSSVDYGILLKNEREKRNLSKSDLAESAGVTRRAIYNWESGARKMTMESADKVFRALGVEVTIGGKA